MLYLYVTRNENLRWKRQIDFLTDVDRDYNVKSSGLTEKLDLQNWRKYQLEFEKSELMLWEEQISTFWMGSYKIWLWNSFWKFINRIFTNLLLQRMESVFRLSRIHFHQKFVPKIFVSQFEFQFLVTRQNWIIFFSFNHSVGSVNFKFESTGFEIEFWCTD